MQRTHSWMNGYGNLRRSTDKRKIVVEFSLYLAAALIVIRRLIPTILGSGVLSTASQP